MIGPVSAYFGAERAESLLFICIGLVALEIAFVCWRKSGSPAAKGAALALVLVAAIQLVVGTTIFIRSPQDQARVVAALQQDKTSLRTTEVPRMQVVMRNFVVYRWVEIGLIALGVLLALGSRRRSWGRGAGIGLAAQASIMLLLDALAERRGNTYLAWLQSL